MSTSTPLDILPEGFWTRPETATATVTTAQQRAMLIYSEGWISAGGKIYDFVFTNLGAGVHRVTLRKRT